MALVKTHLTLDDWFGDYPTIMMMDQNRHREEHLVSLLPSIKILYVRQRSAKLLNSASCRFSSSRESQKKFIGELKRKGRVLSLQITSLSSRFQLNVFFIVGFMNFFSAYGKDETWRSAKRWIRLINSIEQYIIQRHCHLIIYFEAFRTFWDLFM